jgi:copper chaperone
MGNPRLRPLSKEEEIIMLKLKVEGMTCGHCAQTVTKAVEAVPAVERAVVDLKAGEVAVEGNADEATVRRAIEDAGYDVRDAA